MLLPSLHFCCLRLAVCCSFLIPTAVTKVFIPAQLEQVCFFSAKSLQLSGKAHQKLRPVIPQPLNPPKYPNSSPCPYLCLHPTQIFATLPSTCLAHPLGLCVLCHSATLPATTYTHLTSFLSKPLATPTPLFKSSSPPQCAYTPLNSTRLREGCLG